MKRLGPELSNQVTAANKNLKILPHWFLSVFKTADTTQRRRVPFFQANSMSLATLSSMIVAIIIRGPWLLEITELQVVQHPKHLHVHEKLRN